MQCNNATKHESQSFSRILHPEHLYSLCKGHSNPGLSVAFGWATLLITMLYRYHSSPQCQFSMEIKKSNLDLQFILVIPFQARLHWRQQAVRYAPGSFLAHILLSSLYWTHIFLWDSRVVEEWSMSSATFGYKFWVCRGLVTWGNIFGNFYPKILGITTETKCTLLDQGYECRKAQRWALVYTQYLRQQWGY